MGIIYIKSIFIYYNWYNIFGICIDDAGKNKFRYLIAGAYKGGDVPEGMTVYELPDAAWAKFKCVGPLPGALQFFTQDSNTYYS